MCDCSICLRGKRIEDIQNGNDIEKMRELISELHNLVLNLEFDNEINDARVIIKKHSPKEVIAVSACEIDK